MSRNRFDELSELDARVVAEAEADLDRLLAIEPSPELAVKTRARIDAERSSSLRWFSGWQVGFAAAALVIVGIIVTYTLRRGATEVPHPAPVVASVQPPLTLPAPVITTPARLPDQAVPNPVVAQRSHPSLSEPRAASHELAPAKEPEVLVPPDQRMAIDRLLALPIEDRKFPMQVLTQVTGEDVPPVPPIVVDEVSVPPIPVGGRTENDLGRNK